ncbi:MAG: hypothetical protein QHJ73_05335, partial [Armatimonadota bacterium]|nr:hypothetical protein [Armatimonadota bacterium]
MVETTRPVEGEPEEEKARETPPSTQEPASAERDAAHLAELENRLAELTRQLEAKEQEMRSKEKEAREYLEGWQRERANFENYRKRMARELDD